MKNKKVKSITLNEFSLSLVYCGVIKFTPPKKVSFLTNSLFSFCLYLFKIKYSFVAIFSFISSFLKYPFSILIFKGSNSFYTSDKMLPELLKIYSINLEISNKLLKANSFK